MTELDGNGHNIHHNNNNDAIVSYCYYYKFHWTCKTWGLTFAIESSSRSWATERVKANTKSRRRFYSSKYVKSTAHAATGACHCHQIGAHLC